MYVDAGISGKSVMERNGLQALLADANSQKFEGVCVWKMSRLARNLRDLLSIEQQFHQHGIFLKSISESIDTSTPHGRFSLQMLGAMGEMERKVIVENMQMGLTKKSKLGFHVGAAIYGYDLIPKATCVKEKLQTNLVINKSEAQIVQDIFEWYAAGEGLKVIVNRLNELRIPSKKGGIFSINVIRQILQNPIYIGKVKSKSPDGTQYVQGHHQPIITTATWELVESQLSTKVITRKTTHKVFLLTSLIKCPLCKSNMSGRTYTRTQKNGVVRKYYYYVCNRFMNKGKSGCKQVSIPANDVEQAVLVKTHEIIKSATIEKWLYEKINGFTATSVIPRDEQKKIEKSLSELRVMRAQLMLDFEQNRLDPIKFSVEMKASKEKEAHLRAQVAVEKTTVPKEVLSKELIEQYLFQFEKLLKSTEAVQQKEFLQTLFARIDVDEQKQLKQVELLIEDQSIKLPAS